MNAIVLIALKRPYTFVVLAILILIFGGHAVLSTPTDIFPNIGIPVVAVVWTYNGLTPEDMSYNSDPVRLSAETCRSSTATEEALYDSTSGGVIPAGICFSTVCETAVTCACAAATSVPGWK